MHYSSAPACSRWEQCDHRSAGGCALAAGGVHRPSHLTPPLPYLPPLPAPAHPQLKISMSLLQAGKTVVNVREDFADLEAAVLPLLANLQRAQVGGWVEWVGK